MSTPHDHRAAKMERNTQYLKECGKLTLKRKKKNYSIILGTFHFFFLSFFQNKVLLDPGMSFLC